MKQHTLLQLFFLLSLSFTTQLFSQKVSIQFQHRTGYVGVPLAMYVVYENVKGEANPSLPKIDGFTSYKQLGDHKTIQNTFVNGKITSTTRQIVTFVLTPEKAGTFTIPALTFFADGRAFHSTSRQIAIEEPPTSGVLEAEIVGTTGDVYLGRPIDLTLRIFMETFTDPTNGITPDAKFMFRSIRSDSDFGIFTEPLQDGNTNVQRVQGTSSNGIPTSFFIFTIQATTWPETTGELNLSPVTIVADYPLALSRPRRSGFLSSNNPRVEQSKRISTTANSPKIKVVTPPLEGKPSWYSGAVGNFDFRVVADPVQVKVGEPITLTMQVTDLTSGPVNLDYLSAPLLDRLPALTDTFKVPDKPLGGTANGRAKIFTQTIRPRNDSPHEIPSLPFTSYDPVTASYITSWSKAIPIVVEAVKTISAADLVGTSTQSVSSGKVPTEVAGGILANYTGDSLLDSQNIAVTPSLIALITVPPLSFLAILLYFGMAKHSKLPSAKRKCAKKLATRTLKHATKLAPANQATEIAKAIRTLQEENGAGTLLAIQMETLLERCNASQFGGIEDASLANDAVTLVEELS
jgi:hypothetical protein